MTRARKTPLARSIVTLRKKLGLTQESFAEAVGVVTSTVVRWETGVAKPSRLAALAIEAMATTAVTPREVQD